jgi:hypothetical protein
MGQRGGGLDLRCCLPDLYKSHLEPNGLDQSKVVELKQIFTRSVKSNSNVAEERNGMSVPLPLAGLTRCLACLLY